MVSALLTLVAAGVALSSFGRTTIVIENITGHSVPEIGYITSITRDVVSLIALAPAIAQSRDTNELAPFATSRQQHSLTLAEKLQHFSSFYPNNQELGSLQLNSNMLMSNLDDLLDNQKKRLILQNQLNLRIAQCERISDALRLALLPLANTLADKTERRPELYAIQELKAEFNLLYGLLTHMASTGDERVITSLANATQDSLERVELRLQVLSAGAAKDVLTRGRDGLLELTQGQDNIELLRHNYLATRDNIAVLMNGNRDLATRLDQILDNLSAQTSHEVNSSASIIDSALQETRYTLLVLVLIALAGAGILGSLFAGPWIGRRLHELAGHVEAMSAGQLDTPIADQGTDEIGRLADALRSFRALAKERLRIEKQLSQMANYDPLTSLPNRNLLHTRAQEIIARCERSKSRFGVLFIDLDRFKLVNDTQGHEVGDILLKEAAQRIALPLRRLDVVGRLGGDEFVVLVEIYNDNGDLDIVARKIIAQLVEPVTIAHHTFFVGASVGISIYPKDGRDFPDLLRKADTAMYMAKKKGGNATAYYQEEMNTQSSRWVDLERDLRIAIDNEQLELWYQPKADLQTGMLAGAEALVRWRHPALGLIPPNEFIPMAEETGLIEEIGGWVLKRAACDCKRWQRIAGMDFSIAVNLSPRQMQNIKHLQAQIRDALLFSQLPATALELEVTESVLMHNLHDAIALLRELREQGHKIAVDDFGTGYSSLSYIKNLPIDVLKIDKAFVNGLPDDAGDAAVAGAILGIAQALKLSVVAEGVETVAQLNFLRSRHCSLVQGYLLSKPLAPDNFEVFMNKFAGQDVLCTLINH